MKTRESVKELRDKLETYLQCPHKYYFKYGKKEKE